LELGTVIEGLRLVLAVRGGLRGTGAAGPVLGSLSRDTLSGLGPSPLEAGDVLLVGPERGLDAIPTPVPDAAAGTGRPPTELEVPVHAGPRDALMGTSALDRLLTGCWTVRPDSDRGGVRLDGDPVPAPSGSATLRSEPVMPGAVQVRPSGLPVVFGPALPTTGGYPVIAVATRVGLDRLAQAPAGTVLRFVRAGRHDGAMPRLLPEPAYFATLPTAITSAAAVLRDEHGHLVIEKPNYRDHWLLPAAASMRARTPGSAPSGRCSRSSASTSRWGGC